VAAHIADPTTALPQEFFGKRTAGCGFGHRNLQTLHRQTCFCADLSKKEYILMTHEAWRNLNNTEDIVANTDRQKLCQFA
jgi:hypothetical protein